MQNQQTLGFPSAIILRHDRGSSGAEAGSKRKEKEWCQLISIFLIKIFIHVFFYIILIKIL